MNTTTTTKISSIIDYIAKREGGDAAYALGNLDISRDDGDSSGIVIHARACNAEGYCDTLRDCTLIIPDEWEGVLRCSNNGWEWLGCSKCDIDAEAIRQMVSLDASLDVDQIDARTIEICAEIGIAHD